MLAVHAHHLGERQGQLGGPVALAAPPRVGLRVEQLGDVLGEPHEQLAPVAEVEVERGARDTRATGDPLDVQLGERCALGEQRLGGREHARLDLGAFGADGLGAARQGGHAATVRKT